eukprot:UN06988
MLWFQLHIYSKIISLGKVFFADFQICRFEGGERFINIYWDGKK